MGNRYNFRGGNSVILFISSFWKGVYTKRKEFSHRGSIFFPFRVDPFLEGQQIIWMEWLSLKVYLFPSRKYVIKYLTASSSLCIHLQPYDIFCMMWWIILISYSPVWWFKFKHTFCCLYCLPIILSKNRDLKECRHIPVVSQSLKAAFLTN